MHVTDFQYDEVIHGRLVEDGEGNAVYIDYEENETYNVKSITYFENNTLIVTVNGYVYTH